jgi:hypothetical protein
LTPGAQTAHNAAGSDDNSVSFFHDVLASDCTSCTYDASSLPAGDSGRYGQMAFYIVRDPDTVNGFFTATPVTNTQTTTTSVNPGTLTLPTDHCLELFGSATRNHADQLLPVVESPDEWPDELKHEYFDTIPGGGVDYPAAFQNSIISSGAVAGRVNTAGATSTPVWTFTGPVPATAAALSVLVAFNILGGNPVDLDETLAAGAVGITVTAPSATIVPGAATLAAGAQGITVTAPAVTIVPGTVTLSAGANGISVVVPAALIAGVDQVLEAGANGIVVTAPLATLIAGAAPGGVEPSMLRRGDGFTPGIQRRAF